MINKPQLSDLELFLLFKEGDEGAFKIIYERYWQLLFVAAYKILKDEEEAKDVVQDVLISLFNNAADLTISHTVSAYLYTSIRYKVFDALSKRKVRMDHEESLSVYINQGSYSTDRFLIEKEITQTLEREIQNLPRKMRQIFELSRRNKLSHKEIAKTLNISDKTVKKQINNAIKILKPKFTNYYTFFSVLISSIF